MVLYYVLHVHILWCISLYFRKIVLVPLGDNPWQLLTTLVTLSNHVSHFFYLAFISQSHFILKNNINKSYKHIYIHAVKITLHRNPFAWELNLCQHTHFHRDITSSLCSHFWPHVIILLYRDERIYPDNLHIETLYERLLHSLCYNDIIQHVWEIGLSLIKYIV